MKKSKKIVRIFFSVLFSILFIIFIAIGIILEPWFKISGYKTLDNNKLGYFNNATTFINKNGTTLSEEAIGGISTYTPVSLVNQYTIDAFVSAEDKRFYTHKGVDYIRIAGAVVQNIKHMSYKEGASTISQQLIKNTHLNNKKTINRKIQEIRIAKELERSFTKDEILKMYLNSIYFGNGIYGIGTASKVYFNKDAVSLHLDESATLAAIINSPGTYCPYTKYESCMARRNLVLNRMLKNKKISNDEYNTAINTVSVISNNNDLFNHYFNNALLEAAAIIDCDVREIKSKDYKIETFFDLEISNIIDRIYNDIYFEAKSETDFCCVVIANENAEVSAFYGTGMKNYLNYHRSPGSTIKPMIAYAPALESKSIYPISPILDEKTSFGGYSPNNYTDKYLGWISIEDSLAVSSNIAAVKLLDMCGIEYSKKIAERMGIAFEDNDNHLAIALGGMEKGLTLQQIANAYRTFSSGGIYKRCSYIKSIADENGNLIYSDNRMANRAISEESAYLINNMLEKCVSNGTAKNLKGIKNISAKTGTVGTSEGNTDAYCISYCKDYTVAVWLGAKSGYMPNHISGGTLPARINKQIMSEILALDGGNECFSVPDGIEKLYVDKNILETEHKVALANDMTPTTQKIGAFFDVKNLPKEKSIKYFNKFLLYKDNNVFAA